MLLHLREYFRIVFLFILLFRSILSRYIGSREELRGMKGCFDAGELA